MVSGRVIHKSFDSLGSIEVIELGGERSLHFGSSAKQSALFLHAPRQLALSYTRAMMAPLLFLPSPRRVLLIGLGGGSLATFLFHHYPDVAIDAVELRPEVADVAHSHFFLPRDDRITILIEEAANFVHSDRYRDYCDYDLILVDAFNDRGIARDVCGSAFFSECRDRLSERGWLSMNLWSGDFITTGELLRDLAESFGTPALRLEVEGKDNVIGMAGRGPLVQSQLKETDLQARTLQRELEIEFPLLLKGLRRLNPGFFR